MQLYAIYSQVLGMYIIHCQLDTYRRSVEAGTTLQIKFYLGYTAGSNNANFSFWGNQLLNT
jgi:hypothetical protein